MGHHAIDVGDLVALPSSPGDAQRRGMPGAPTAGQFVVHAVTEAILSLANNGVGPSTSGEALAGYRQAHRGAIRAENSYREATGQQGRVRRNTITLMGHFGSNMLFEMEGLPHNFRITQPRGGSVRIMEEPID